VRRRVSEKPKNEGVADKPFFEQLRPAKPSILLRENEVFYKSVPFSRTAENKKNISKMESQRCPKRPSDASRAAPGTALDRQGVAQNFSFAEAKLWIS